MQLKKKRKGKEKKKEKSKKEKVQKEKGKEKNKPSRLLRLDIIFQHSLKGVERYSLSVKGSSNLWSSSHPV